MKVFEQSHLKVNNEFNLSMIKKGECFWCIMAGLCIKGITKGVSATCINLHSGDTFKISLEQVVFPINAIVNHSPLPIL